MNILLYYEKKKKTIPLGIALNAAGKHPRHVRTWSEWRSGCTKVKKKG